MIDENNNGRGLNNGSVGLDEEKVIATLDDEGNEHYFAIADVFEVKENKYAILIPMSKDGEYAGNFAEDGDEFSFEHDEDDDDDDDMMVTDDDMIAADDDMLDEEGQFTVEEEDTIEMEGYLFRVVNEAGEEIFEEIEDEDEIEAVMAEWERRNPDFVL